MIIRNGTIVTETDTIKTDLVIRDGKVAFIGKDTAENSGEEIYDASGCYIFPGGVDPHTHMELQQSEKYRSVDDFYTGTVAAACGGTTTIIDHIAFSKEGANLHESINRYYELGEKSVIDYGFHGVLQHIDDNILKELDGIIQKEGIPSFKGYSTYGFKLENSDFMQVLEQMQKSGGLLTVHAEDDSITNFLRDKMVEEGHTDPIYHAESRPNRTEALTMASLIQTGLINGGAPLYFVHTSTKEGLNAIKNGRKEGYKRLYCETCTQYLTLTDEKYYENGKVEGLKYLMAPPLRSKEDNEALWEGLSKGSVQVVATDHCPFYLEQKEDGIDNFTLAPGGSPGVEERMIVLFSEGVMKNRINLNQYVSVTSANAARIFGIYPQKGALLPGSDADVLIIDPNQKYRIKSENMKTKCGYSIYDNMEITGKVRAVFSKGKLIVENDKFLGERGEGDFLQRKPFKEE